MSIAESPFAPFIVGSARREDEARLRAQEASDRVARLRAELAAAEVESAAAERDLTEASAFRTAVWDDFKALDPIFGQVRGNADA